MQKIGSSKKILSQKVSVKNFSWEIENIGLVSEKF